MRLVLALGLIFWSQLGKTDSAVRGGESIRYFEGAVRACDLGDAFIANELMVVVRLVCELTDRAEFDAARFQFDLSAFTHVELEQIRNGRGLELFEKTEVHTERRESVPVYDPNCGSDAYSEPNCPILGLRPSVVREVVYSVRKR